MANVVTMFGRLTRTETRTTAAKTSTLSSTGAFANGFRAFAGDSNKLPPANETPVETRARKTLVKAMVKHAVRCVEVQEMERKALVIQKYWRSFAANRELRRRRWALRRARAGAVAVAAAMRLPRNVFKAFGALLWSFFLSFRVVRALAWLAVRLPRALVRATYSWEGAAGTVLAAYLAASRKHPDAVFLYNFQDFLTLYVAAFVALDIYAPKVLAPALRANGVARRHARLGIRAVGLFAASKCKPPAEKKAHRAMLRVGILDAMPVKTAILSPVRAPPLVVPTKRSKDPELLKAVADANQAARDSSRFADEAATQADELEEKLSALATTMEVRVVNKLEGKLRAIGDASKAQYEAAKAMMSGACGPAINTTIVDERIDKRFEDMEAMIREARDEGRAEGFREIERMRRHSGELDDDEREALRRGMEKGLIKGVELERERRRKKSVKYKIKSALGIESSKTKRDVEKQQLEELKGAILNRDTSPPPRAARARTMSM